MSTRRRRPAAAGAVWPVGAGASAGVERLSCCVRPAPSIVRHCRFTDCMHLAEPGCAVTTADLERHEHYVKFLAEIKVGS